MTHRRYQLVVSALSTVLPAAICLPAAGGVPPTKHYVRWRPVVPDPDNVGQFIPNPENQRAQRVMVLDDQGMEVMGEPHSGLVGFEKNNEDSWVLDTELRDFIAAAVQPLLRPFPHVDRPYFRFQFVICTCYGGGMLDELADLPYTLACATAARYDECSWQPFAGDANDTGVNQSFATLWPLAMGPYNAANPYGPAFEPVAANVSATDPYGLNPAAPRGTADKMGMEHPQYFDQGYTTNVFGAVELHYGMGGVWPFIVPIINPFNGQALVNPLTGRPFHQYRHAAILWCGQPDKPDKRIMADMIDRLVNYGFSTSDIYALYGNGTPPPAHAVAQRLPAANILAATNAQLEAVLKNRVFPNVRGRTPARSLFFFASDHGFTTDIKLAANAPRGRRGEPDKDVEDGSPDGGGGSGQQTPPPLTQLSVDCNTNGTDDADEIAANTQLDCDADGALDGCRSDAFDVNTNGTPDFCEDCQPNGVPDGLDVVGGTSLDCNTDGAPDECQGGQDANLSPDACDIAGGAPDANTDGVPDSVQDCNSNGTVDSMELASGGAPDCNSNSVPDPCDLDANTNGSPDACDIAGAHCTDCNLDGICDAGELPIMDCNSNGIVDDCESLGIDCNTTGIPDLCEINERPEQDCNTNGTPDECESPCAGCRGDLNGDSRIDAADIEGLVECLVAAAPGNCAACGCADLNGDGVVDNGDLPVFVCRLITCNTSCTAGAACGAGCGIAP